MTAPPYDIANPPPAAEWLAMNEEERIALVETAHRLAGAAVGQNASAHASLHVVIENRLAAGHSAVVDAYERCRAAGLSRHTTIHALASIATKHMMAVLEQRPSESADDDYASLDPEAWKPKR